MQPVVCSILLVIEKRFCGNKMKKISICLILLLFHAESFAVGTSRGAQGLSGFTVGKEVDVTSSLFSLSEESFPEVHQYLNYILNYEKTLPNSKEEALQVPRKASREIAVKLTPKVRKFCKKVNKRFLDYGWGNSKCNRYPWNHVRNSVKGDPLTWVTYGSEPEHKKSPRNTTLILCGVHGDEITPIKFCYDIMKHVESNKKFYSEKLIVIAPIVNPDSFFRRRPTRTNYRGIDINRNFPTRDWRKNALKMWKRRYRKDKRRYPGRRPLSEPEVIFQVNLIKRYKPNKIISVHAPLTIIDYDGPTRKNRNYKKASQLLIQMSRKASGYRIKNYPFFPGSLGNWAGNERGIPTYTLELPSSDNRKHKEYWSLFKSAIHAALLKDFRVEKESL